MRGSESDSRSEFGGARTYLNHIRVCEGGDFGPGLGALVGEAKGPQPLRRAPFARGK